MNLPSRKHFFLDDYFFIMTLKSVIDQNNMTVALLRDQDSSHAIQASSEALRRHKMVVSSEKESLPTNKNCTDSLDQCMVLSVIDESKVESGMPFIYDHGILLPSTMTDSTAISAILIFNSALSHQLCAMQNPASASALFLKARHLYNLAYRMQGAEGNILFQIAIANNMIVIERSLGNEDVSKNHFDQLLSWWMLLLDQGYGPRLHPVRGFLVNGQWTKTASAA
mmetsp:Transcript_26790/g.65144  ORF Transcript_26790/g.65144 Transcript_26790/m.65144 type:complete len:225 (+) Transcript_26790:83-757(+)